MKKLRIHPQVDELNKNAPQSHTFSWGNREKSGSVTVEFGRWVDVPDCVIDLVKHSEYKIVQPDREYHANSPHHLGSEPKLREVMHRRFQYDVRNA